MFVRTFLVTLESHGVIQFWTAFLWFWILQVHVCCYDQLSLVSWLHSGDNTKIFQKVNPFIVVFQWSLTKHQFGLKCLTLSCHNFCALVDHRSLLDRQCQQVITWFNDYKPCSHVTTPKFGPKFSLSWQPIDMHTIYWFGPKLTQNGCGTHLAGISVWIS